MATPFSVLLSFTAVFLLADVTAAKSPNAPNCEVKGRTCITLPSKPAMDFLNRLMKAPGAAKSTMGLHDRTLVAFSFEKCPISRVPGPRSCKLIWTVFHNSAQTIFTFLMGEVAQAAFFEHLADDGGTATAYCDEGHCGEGFYFGELGKRCMVPGRTCERVPLSTAKGFARRMLEAPDDPNTNTKKSDGGRAVGRSFYDCPVTAAGERSDPILAALPKLRFCMFRAATLASGETEYELKIALPKEQETNQFAILSQFGATAYCVSGQCRHSYFGDWGIRCNKGDHPQRYCLESSPKVADGVFEAVKNSKRNPMPMKTDVTYSFTKLAKCPLPGGFGTDGCYLMALFNENDGRMFEATVVNPSGPSVKFGRKTGIRDKEWLVHCDNTNGRCPKEEWMKALEA